jgi:hypothetical protein
VRKIFEIGGIAAGIVLIAFGIAAIVLGVNGKNTVASSLKEQAIVGTPDMTPAAIKAEAAKAGLPATIKLPTCTVAGKAVTDGATARCFADYMRIHAYESTGGQPYSQMGRFLDANGQATNDESKAAINPETKRPVENGARNIWVTETALTTALNMSYMADQLGHFGIVVGIALLLSGFGFVILAVGGALRAGGWLFARNAAKATTKSTIAVGA